MNYIIKEEIGDAKNIFEKFKRKDFSGNTGQVMKNSSYQLATSLIAKFGSLIFTIIIARMLGVELFGLYTLALSTIILFSTFSDLGLTTAMETFVSKSLGQKNQNKAKTYFKSLLRHKIHLLTIVALLLISIGFLLSSYYYNKPIYYALLAGIIYIPCVGLMGYLSGLFRAVNNFGATMAKEIILQVSKITLIPIVIIYLLKSNLNNATIIAIIILIISFCYILALLYLRIAAKEQVNFIKEKSKRLTPEDKQELKKFILPLSFTAISGMFFGYIDTLMLGHYVDVTHIGFYGASFALVGSAAAIIGFIPGAILPIFSRMEKTSLQRMFRRIRTLIFFIGISSAIFTFFIAEYILLIYGFTFVQAAILLQILSILLITSPLAGLYVAYFTSIKKTGIIAKLLVSTTLINIVLNIIFIKYGLQFGMMQAAIGACVATVLSRIIYLSGLVIWKRKNI